MAARHCAGMSCHSVPPNATFSTCAPRQIPSSGFLCCAAARHSVSSTLSRRRSVLVSWGTGLWPGLEEKAAQVSRLDKTYLPNPANRAAYDELIARYDTLLAATKPVTRRL